MNEPDQNLLHQLERITAREAIPPIADDETADLRQAWQQFTQLLDEADTQADETEILDRVLLPPSRLSWHAVAARAVAASLLIALTATWIARSSSPLYQPPTGATSAPVRNLAGPSANSVPDEFAWSDTLDQQLDEAGQALIGMQTAWQREDMLFRVLHERLERIEQEMETESL